MEITREAAKSYAKNDPNTGNAGKVGREGATAQRIHARAILRPGGFEEDDRPDAFGHAVHDARDARAAVAVTDEHDSAPISKRMTFTMSVMWG
jgi:hypothetical protein